MRFTIISALAAGIGLVNAYTQPNYSDPPTGNAIIYPGLNEQVPVGKPYTITWKPTTPGNVSLVLLRGPSTNCVPLMTIVEDIPNTGSYVWTPPTTLEPDVTHYGMLLVVEGTGQYQYSTQFGISNPNAAASSSAPAVAVSTPVAVTSTPVAPISTSVAPVSTPAATDSTPGANVPSDSEYDFEPESSSVLVPTAVVTTTICDCTKTTATSSATGTGFVSIVKTPSASGTPAPPLFTGAAGRNHRAMGGVVAAAAGIAAFVAF
ncbi:GPI anchored serine-threonine rich protein [Thermoascus aurantiacus ATCC 26904]